MVVAKILVYDRDGKLLVLRRSSTHPAYAFHSDFPGGIVEHDESPLVAVVRELDEEAGLIVPQDQVELVLTLPTAPGSSHALFMTRLTQSEPTVTISWEHDQARWLTPQALIDEGLPDYVDEYYEQAYDYLRDAFSA